MTNNTRLHVNEDGSPLTDTTGVDLASHPLAWAQAYSEIHTRFPDGIRSRSETGEDELVLSADDLALHFLAWGPVPEHKNSDCRMPTRQSVDFYQEVLHRLGGLSVGNAQPPADAD